MKLLHDPILIMTRGTSLCPACPQMGGNEALVEHEKHAEQAKNYDYSYDAAVKSLETEEEESSPAEESPAVDESLFTLV